MHRTLALAFLLLVGIGSTASAQVVRARESLGGGGGSSGSPERGGAWHAPYGLPRAPQREVRRRSDRILWTPEPRYWLYRPHPYAHGGAGYTFDPRDEPRASGREGLFSLAVRLGYLLGEVGEVDVRAAAVLGIFELFARQRVLVEAIAPNGVEALGLSHIGVGIRISRSQTIRASGHLDCTLAEDGAAVFGGVAVGLDLDVYFARPWAFSVEASAAMLVHTWVLEGGVSFAVLEGPVELHVGWNVLVFAPYDGSTPVPFTGPSLTFRGWAS